jgi:hypothetical protein
VCGFDRGGGGGIGGAWWLGGGGWWFGVGGGGWGGLGLWWLWGCLGCVLGVRFFDSYLWGGAVSLLVDVGCAFYRHWVSFGCFVFCVMVLCSNLFGGVGLGVGFVLSGGVCGGGGVGWVGGCMVGGALLVIFRGDLGAMRPGGGYRIVGEAGGVCQVWGGVGGAGRWGGGWMNGEGGVVQRGCDTLVYCQGSAVVRLVLRLGWLWRVCMDVVASVSLSWIL